jgi:hypothetical protein
LYQAQIRNAESDQGLASAIETVEEGAV